MDRPSHHFVIPRRDPTRHTHTAPALAAPNVVVCYVSGQSEVTNNVNLETLHLHSTGQFSKSSPRCDHIGFERAHDLTAAERAQDINGGVLQARV